jgi:hypothetical protein
MLEEFPSIVAWAQVMVAMVLFAVDRTVAIATTRKGAVCP